MHKIEVLLFRDIMKMLLKRKTKGFQKSIRKDNTVFCKWQNMTAISLVY